MFENEIDWNGEGKANRVCVWRIWLKEYEEQECWWEEEGCRWEEEEGWEEDETLIGLFIYK